MILPRLMKQPEAAEYCGVSIPTFKSWIEPMLPPKLEKPSKRKIGKFELYDRHDIDAAIDKLKQQQFAEHDKKSDDKGSGKRSTMKGNDSWAENSQALSTEKASGTSTSSTGEDAFAKALSRVRGQKRSAS